MNAKSPTTASTRRNFLVGASVATAGAVAAVVTGNSVNDQAAAPLSADSQPEKVRGYHVTPHIEQYYETTRM